MTIPGGVGGGSGSHILVFPYPAQGHMIPLLDLAHHLATRGLTITIVVTPKNHPPLTPLLSLHSYSIRPLILNFPKHPSIPSGVENHKDLPQKSFHLMIHAMEGLYNPLLEWWTNQDSPPVAIISDMFLGWTKRLATQVGVPGLVFSPSGAMALSVMYSIWRNQPQKPADDCVPVTFSNMPNSPSYPWWQVSPFYRRYLGGDPDMESIKESFLSDVASWGLVVNTFMELEGVYLDFLKKDLGHNRVWAVGPLLPSDDEKSGPNKRGGTSAESAAEVLSWLDTCEDHSVVYVGFGSQYLLTNEQMGELALGLEKSGAKFIWCAKEPTDGNLPEHYGVVPPGFEDRTSGRGRVVRGWAPQVQILSHRAVGVFLTHCGWNSTLESIFAGVPLLAWPLSADQFSNATLLVEQLGVAVRACEGFEAVPDSDELASLFSESLSEGRAERAQATNLRKAALNAINKDGSSCNDLDDLVSHLSI